MLRRLFSSRSVDKKKYVKLRHIAHLYESGNSDIRTKFIKRYVLSEDISRIFWNGVLPGEETYIGHKFEDDSGRLILISRLDNKQFLYIFDEIRYIKFKIHNSWANLFWGCVTNTLYTYRRFTFMGSVLFTDKIHIVEDLDDISIRSI